MPSTVRGYAQHGSAIASLPESYRGLPTNAPIRLAKKTSNLFRPRIKPAVPVAVGPDRVNAPTNRAIEAKVGRLGGHKSLYSEAFYGREEFNALYNGSRLEQVKKTYAPDDRLTSLYDKAVRQQ